ERQPESVDGHCARGYVDAAASAREWAGARPAGGYGAARVWGGLGAGGIAPPVSAAALRALGGDDTLASARETARRRLPALRRGRPDRVAPRLRDYLLRRGFSTSIVVRVVRETTGVAAEE